MATKRLELSRVSQEPYSNTVPQEKAYYTFIAGLNTDASPLAFPDNFSSDEENFVLDIDGSRQRRKGLALEEGGTVVGIQNDNPGVVRAFHWRNVNGDPTLDFCVIQNGTELLFFEDDTSLVLSTGYIGSYDLLEHKTDSSTDEEVAASYVNMDYGRGHLFVVGSVIEPFYIEYDPDTKEFTTIAIDIEHRDFEGIDDGIAVNTTPSDLIQSHIYNLKNAGWLDANITNYKNSKAVYPSKNMIHWRGMAGQKVTDVAETDWTKEFSADKIEAELFADTPAPNGRFKYSIWNKQYVIGDAPTFAIAAWDLANDTAGSNTMHIQVDGDHGLSDNDDVYVYEHLAAYYYKAFLSDHRSVRTWSADGQYNISIDNRTITGATNANPAVFTCVGHGLMVGDNVTLALTGGTWNTLDGAHVITAVTDDTFTFSTLDGTSLGSFTSGTATPLNSFEITVITPSTHLGWKTKYLKKGSIWTSYEETTEGAISRRPSCVAFFAGRTWYSGIQDAILSSRVYFSQVVINDNQYGKCYQAADPTSQYISDLVDTDGGYITIPEMDSVKEIMPYNGKLLVFADNGIWEIGGGERGYFTATGYSVRQVANMGCVSSASVVVAEGTPYFLSDAAIYAIQQDPYQGYLLAKDITTGKIQNLLKQIPKDQKAVVQASYDKNSQRVIWLYDNSNTVDYVFPYWLELDLRIGAFSKFGNKSLTYDIRTVYDIEHYQATSNEQRNIKFMCDTSARNQLTIAELNDESFEDFGVDASAYVETGNDGLGDVTRRRYGKYLFTYMERTENVDGDNPSECFVRYMWNWVDSSSSGAWNTPRSVYRRWSRKYRNPLVPSDGDAVMGEPVCVARSKIRGSGKVLRLRFDTEAGKKCRLYGWQLRQDLNTEA